MRNNQRLASGHKVGNFFREWGVLGGVEKANFMGV